LSLRLDSGEQIALAPDVAAVERRAALVTGDAPRLLRRLLLGDCPSLAVLRGSAPQAKRRDWWLRRREIRAGAWGAGRQGQRWENGQGVVL